MIVNVPDWCVINKRICWNAPEITGYKWVYEYIISYGVDGFFHKSAYGPVYFTKFSEYGNTIKEVNEIDSKEVVYF